MKRISIIAIVVAVATSWMAAAELRIGLIGLDTSHVTAFTQLLNDPTAKDHVPGGRVVAAFKGGSPDLESSRSRVDGYTRELQDKHGVKLYDSIEEMCRHVDAVMLESVDGRPHLAQAVPVILARKPLYIDKPMAASLRDVLAIFRLAAEYRVPVFSASSLRFGKNTQAVRRGALGRVLTAETSSPCSLEPSHPDLFWYGIHGVESLFTVMGPGCETVRRGQTTNGLIEVTGTWRGGRLGIYREGSGYAGLARGEKGEMAVGAYDGYAPLVAEVIKFFQTGRAPVAPHETIELFAFMEAADESKRQNGAEILIRDVLKANGYLPPPRTELVAVRKLWDAAPHNAFTDLVRHQQQWFCVFREGQSHVSPDGAIRVLTSRDGESWESAARLTSSTADLRDPKIVATPDGQLMLTAAGALHATDSARHQTFAWFSRDGRAWGEPVPIGEPNQWLWRVTWHQGAAYGIGYDTTGERFIRLYRSRDGRRFEVLVPSLHDRDQPNETSLVFRSDDTALCLLRRDGQPGTGQLGLAKPPYTDWQWLDLGVKLGGPHLIQLKDKRLLAGVRLYDGAVRTSLAWVDADRGHFTECLALPSGGDTSYPGLVWDDPHVWVSYYSSHEGKSAIYLAKVRLE